MVSRWLHLLGFVLGLTAATASAQVPQSAPFTGRLVDDLGAPLAGPVGIELRIFDASSGGAQLYSEVHAGVPLDASGGFFIELGKGGSPGGTFDAELFDEATR